MKRFNDAKYEMLQSQLDKRNEELKTQTELLEAQKLKNTDLSNIVSSLSKSNKEILSKLVNLLEVSQKDKDKDTGKDMKDQLLQNEEFQEDLNLLNNFTKPIM